MSKLTDEHIEAIYKQETGALIDDSPWALVDFSRAIESAATEPLLQRIAELEQRNSDLHEDVQRFKKHALNEKAVRLELERQLEEARKDAERYRWIRKQHWSENILGVVVRPKDQTKPGSMLPSMELLDDTIDHMSSKGTAMQKGQQ